MAETFGDARDDVLARLGAVEDGANNPAHVIMVGNALNSAERQLRKRLTWTALQARAVLAWAGGTAVMAVPAVVRPGWIRAVHWRQADRTIRLDGAVDAVDEYRHQGTPVYYQAMSEYRATGVEPVAPHTYVMLLDPIPDQAGELWIDFTREPGLMTDEADALSLDYEAVVTRAAADVAPVIAGHLAQMMEARAAQALREAMSEQGSGRTISFSARRRR